MARTSQVHLAYCCHGNNELWPPGFQSADSSGAAGSHHCCAHRVTHVTARECPQHSWPGENRLPLPLRTTGPRGGGRHCTSPPGTAAGELSPSHPLAGMRQPLSGQSAGLPPSHEVCAQTSHFCPHTAFGSRAQLALPLPRQASRACHIPTFTATKKGDPEPGLVGVPSSHSSRRNTSSSSRTLSKKPIASSSSSMAAGGAEGKQEAGSTQQQQPLPPPPRREAGGQGGEERAGQA